MKRVVAVCMLASVMLAGTTAFATPVSVVIPGTAVYDNTVSSGFDKSSGFTNNRIIWFQPFAFSPAAPDLSAYPAGGTLVLTDSEITNATQTIVAWGVSPQGPQKDYVYRGSSSSGPWTDIIPGGKYLNAGPAPFGLGDSTTVITLADADTWLAPTGYWTRVTLQDGNQDDYVKSSALHVVTDYEWTYTYDVPAEPVIPAPGAILLASMGAGLVSWLRSRRVL